MEEPLNGSSSGLSTASDVESLMKGLYTNVKSSIKNPHQRQRSLFSRIISSSGNVILACGLVGSIVLGVRGFPIKLFGGEITIGSFSITFSDDLQLTIVGVLTKIIDYLLNMSIEHLAGISITSLMVVKLGNEGYRSDSTRPKGVISLDLDLANEMTKPWLTVYNFYQRIKIYGLRKIGVWGYIKFLLTLVVAFTVLLMTSALNTVAVPKKRWAPFKTYCSSAQRISSLEYQYIGSQALNTGISRSEADKRASTLIAAEAWAATQNTYAVASTNEYWQTLVQTGLMNSDNYQRITAIKINRNETSGFSIRWQALQDLFEAAANSTDSFGKDAIGAAGLFNVTAPSITVSCEELELNRPQGIDTFSVEMKPTSNTDRPSSQIVLGPSSKFTDFKGANCSLEFRQIYYTPSAWLADETYGRIDYAWVDRDINQLKTSYEPTILPQAQNDPEIAANITRTLNETLPIIDRLTDGFVSFMVDLGKSVEGKYPESPSGVATIAVGLAAIAQHSVTLADWSYLDAAGEVCSSLRWEIYGSGPRLAWQWAIGVFIGFGVLIAFADFLTRINPKVYVAEWLDVFGMMILANSSPKLHFVGEAREVAEKKAFYVGETEDGEPELRQMN
ncbi:hypothetical protein TWF694_011311 [Orbilia ellipsospora]|uniref:Uncharacterized protein n=1 Tax=Orbilia ellipsospora TaxID=2528407 RepID=A0AAV9X7T0_9PEZI